MSLCKALRAELLPRTHSNLKTAPITVHIPVCVNRRRGWGGPEYFRNLYLPLIEFPLWILGSISSSGGGTRIVAYSHGRGEGVL
jgi:hypothetical protein